MISRDTDLAVRDTEVVALAKAGVTYRTISDEIGRTPQRARQIAVTNGVPSRLPRRAYTPADEAVIERDAGRKTCAELAASLGRTYQSMCNHLAIRKIKAHSPARDAAWTRSEVAKLKRLLRTKRTFEQIAAEMPGRNRNQIAGKVKRLRDAAARRAAKKAAKCH